MAIKVRPADDAGLLAMLGDRLAILGFTHQADGHILHVEKAGVGTGDSSVALDIEILTLDDVRVVRLDSLIAVEPANFERAQIAQVQGNAMTVLAKFRLAEINGLAESNRFLLHAQLTLYADYLAQDEFLKMVRLFVAEIDEVDNGLRQVLRAPA